MDAYELFMQDANNKHLRDLLNNIDWTGTKAMNEIIANSKVFIQMDTKNLLREMQANNARLDTLTNEMQAVKLAIYDKDTTVINKIYTDEIKIKQQRVLNSI